MGHALWACACSEPYNKGNNLVTINQSLVLSEEAITCVIQNAIYRIWVIIYYYIFETVTDTTTIKVENSNVSLQHCNIPSPSGGLITTKGKWRLKCKRFR
jgi:hypothetical protein